MCCVLWTIVLCCVLLNIRRFEITKIKMGGKFVLAWFKGTLSRSAIFYMLKYWFCWVHKHICCPYWIFDSPRIKQKLKFLALVRHVKVAIRNNKWHVKVAIRNNKWHAKLAIRNNKWHTKLAIRNNILDSLFCMPLIVPDSHFYMPH